MEKSERTNYETCLGRVVKFGLGDVVCTLKSDDKFTVTGIFVEKNRTDIIVVDKNNKKHPVAQQYLKLADS